METRFEVQFKEIVEAFCLGFEDIHLVNDGGYERGYAEGHDVGFAEGEVVGFQNGEVAGFSDAISKQTELTVRKNGEYLPKDNATGFSKVNVDLPPFSVEEKQIIFIDYDGTVLYSYTPEEVLALTELPSHESTDELLTFDGWNWTLEDLKEEINTIGLDFMQNHKMAIGATYQTLDNNTYLFIKLDTPRKITVCFSPRSNSSVVSIEWGDGSEPSEKTGTTSQTSLTHTYEKTGSYRICISGELSAFGSTNWNIFNGQTSNSFKNVGNFLEKAYLSGFYHLYGGAFRNCFSLKSVVMSNGIKTATGDDLFRYCYSLKAFVGAKTLYSQLGRYCFSNSAIEKISLPRNEFEFEGYFIQNANQLRYFHIPSASKLSTSYSDYIFGTAKGIESFALIPTASTAAYSDLFSGNDNLKHIMLKNVSILSYTFSSCYSLIRFKAYDNITSLNGSVFNGCYSLEEIDFTACTSVPTLSSTSAFSNVPSTCKILVRASLYDEWKTATNWSSSSISSKIVAVEV